MKIVINNCFGGFGLSPLAIKEWAKKKGKECHFFTHDLSSRQLVALTVEQASETFSFSAYTVPNPQDYRLNERGEDGTFKDANARSNEIHLYYGDIPRNDPDLVAVVEELGRRANGRCAELKVVEIPDDVEWEVSEYDGAEHIAETHRTWS